MRALKLIITKTEGHDEMGKTEGKTVNKQMLKITILVVMFVQMATNGLSPAISEIAAAFPGAADSTVQLLMSIPGIFVVVLSFVSAGLTARFPKKFLIGLGLACVTLVGVFGTLFHGSLQILFVWSCLMGLGMGLVISLAASLITDFYEGKEAENLMGLQTSAGNIGGMIMTAIGGMLTAVAWNLDYCVYFIAVPGLILLLLFVPGGKSAVSSAPEKGDIPEAEKGDGQAILKKKKVWVYVIFCFMVLFLFNAGPTNLAMYVSEFEIGSTVISGWAATVFLLGGTLMGIAFGTISRKVGVCTIPIGFLCVAVGFGILISSTSIVCLFAGSLIAGMSISLVSSQALLQLSSYAETPQESALAAALVFAGSNVGTFLTPQITNLAKLFSGSDSTYYRFLLALVFALIMVVITLIFTLRERRLQKKAAAV